MSQTFVDLMKDHYARVARGETDTLSGILSPDAIVLTPFGTFTRDQWKEAGDRFLAAIPNLHHELSNWIESDGAVAVEVKVLGDFINPLETESGTIPPTGKPVELLGCTFVNFENGVVTRWRDYLDPDVLTQLGLGAMSVSE